MSAPRFTRPVHPWTPPLDNRQLTTVLNRLRDWTAFDGCALLDDVAAALDDVPPADEDTAQLAEWFREHLAQGRRPPRRPCPAPAGQLGRSGLLLSARRRPAPWRTPRPNRPP